MFALDVAELVEQLLSTPQILGSIPVIGKFYLLSTELNVLKRKKEKDGSVVEIKYFWTQVSTRPVAIL